MSNHLRGIGLVERLLRSYPADHRTRPACSVNPSMRLKSRVPVTRLPLILGLVLATTLALLALEISTWTIHRQVDMWSIRIARALLEVCLVAVLSVVVLRRKRYCRSNLVVEMNSRELGEERYPQEVAARESLEGDLRRGEEPLRLAMEAARIGYWDWDVIKDEQVWSDICKSLLGVPPDSPANFQVLMNSVHPDDRKMMWGEINGAIQEKRDYVFTFRVIWPDGSVHWQAAKGRAFYDDTGRTTRMIGIAMDIDERKSAEAQLHLQAAALEAAANAIVITDGGGNILWVNRAFCNLTGYSKEESVGQNPRMLKSFEHGKSFYKDLWTTIQSGQVWRGEIRNRKKDGSVYSEEMTITPVHSPSGEINFIAIKQDVTETKQMEAQYRQAQKMEAVGRLAGGLAHDFNNILGVIIGCSEISLDKLEASHPLAKCFLQIKAAADRAASLTRQLLAFSRQQVTYPRLIDLKKVIENLSDMLRRVVGEDVTNTFRPTVPLGTIKVDVGQIEQVLMNLVVNARDAMPNGGRITIETGNVELDESYHREHEPVQPGHYVLLSVSDTGCGMDEVTKAHIFEPFYTTKEPGKGTGLGLSTVYGIIKQSGGYIWVYSEPGTGTTFKIYLPRVGEPAEVISRPGERVRPRGGSETILLVEDDEPLRELIVSTLRNAGYSVLEADAPEKALALMKKNEGTVHLLLTDMVMPQISGIQLLKLLRASSPELRAILMSGYAADVVARHIPIPPDTPFIEKPFTRVSLLSTIRAVLDE